MTSRLGKLTLFSLLVSAFAGALARLTPPPKSFAEFSDQLNRDGASRGHNTGGANLRRKIVKNNHGKDEVVFEDVEKQKDFVAFKKDIIPALFDSPEVMAERYYELNHNNAPSARLSFHIPTLLVSEDENKLPEKTKEVLFLFYTGDIEALIFDCDGTLIDSMEYFWHSWDKALLHLPTWATRWMFPEEQGFIPSGKRISRALHFTYHRFMQTFGGQTPQKIGEELLKESGEMVVDKMESLNWKDWMMPMNGIDIGKRISHGRKPAEIKSVTEIIGWVGAMWNNWNSEEFDAMDMNPSNYKSAKIRAIQKSDEENNTTTGLPSLPMSYLREVKQTPEEITALTLPYVKLGVASSSDGTSLTKHLTRLGLMDYLDVIVGAKAGKYGELDVIKPKKESYVDQEQGQKVYPITIIDKKTEVSKPTKWIFHVAAEEAEVDVTKAVGYEDAPNGMEALENANFRHIIDVTSFKSHPDIRGMVFEITTEDMFPLDKRGNGVSNPSLPSFWKLMLTFEGMHELAVVSSEVSTKDLVEYLRNTYVTLDMIRREGDFSKNVQVLGRNVNIHAHSERQWMESRFLENLREADAEIDENGKDGDKKKAFIKFMTIVQGNDEETWKVGDYEDESSIVPGGTFVQQNVSDLVEIHNASSQDASQEEKEIQDAAEPATRKRKRGTESSIGFLASKSSSINMSSSSKSIIAEKKEKMTHLYTKVGKAMEKFWKIPIGKLVAFSTVDFSGVDSPWSVRVVDSSASKAGYKKSYALNGVQETCNSYYEGQDCGNGLITPTDLLKYFYTEREGQTAPVFVFDMDGTIIDSMPYYHEFMLQALAKFKEEGEEMMQDVVFGQDAISQMSAEEKTKLKDQWKKNIPEIDADALMTLPALKYPTKIEFLRDLAGMKVDDIWSQVVEKNMKDYLQCFTKAPAADLFDFDSSPVVHGSAVHGSTTTADVPISPSSPISDAKSKEYSEKIYRDYVDLATRGLMGIEDSIIKGAMAEGHTPASIHFVVEMIRKLKTVSKFAAKGFKIAVATSTSQERASKFLKAVGLHETFDLYLYGDDPEIPNYKGVSPSINGAIEEKQKRIRELEKTSATSTEIEQQIELEKTVRKEVDQLKAEIKTLLTPLEKKIRLFTIAADRLGVRPSSCFGFEDAVIGIFGGYLAGYRGMLDVRNDYGYPSYGEFKMAGVFKTRDDEQEEERLAMTVGHKNHSSVTAATSISGSSTEAPAEVPDSEVPDSKKLERLRDSELTYSKMEQVFEDMELTQAQKEWTFTKGSIKLLTDKWFVPVH